jgi:hypothetical protein
MDDKQLKRLTGLLEEAERSLLAAKELLSGILGGNLDFVKVKYF